MWTISLVGPIEMGGMFTVMKIRGVWRATITKTPDLTISRKYPCAVAQSKIVSMRPLMREAVSGLVVQIGRRLAITSVTSISSIGLKPKEGVQYAPRVLVHCLRCFSFFHVTECVPIKRSRHSSKVSASVFFADDCFLCSRRTRIGSNPSSRSLLQSRAFLRASARPTFRTEPRPISRDRPSALYRNIQDFVPVDATCK